MKYNLKGKSPEEIRELYEQFLPIKELSGLTSNISNYRNAYTRDEIKQALKKACGTDNLYSIVDVLVLQKVISELITYRQKYKDDKSKYKRLKDCGSYINKYIKFLELCEVDEVEPEPKEEEKPEAKDGYVYIITNPSFLKFYVKIGFSKNPVEERIKELYDTPVPLPFEIYATLKTPKFKQAEKMMHKALETSRINPDREFFMLKPEEALEQMKIIAEGLEAEICIYGKDGKVKKTIKY